MLRTNSSPDLSHHTPLVLLCALAVLATAGPARADGAPADELSAFAGTWTHVGGDAEHQARLDAIDDVAASMPPMARSKVRSKLTEGPGIQPSFTIEVAGDELTIGAPGGESLTTPVDGTKTKVVKDGKTAHVTREIVDGALRSRAELSGGWTSTLYRLSEDGWTMTVVRESGSDRLPRPLEFEATYRKQ